MYGRWKKYREMAYDLATMQAAHYTARVGPECSFPMWGRDSQESGG